MTSVFYSIKEYGSYGDVLKAVGLAELINIIFDCGEITIEEDSGYFKVEAERTIDFDILDIEELKRYPGFPYVQFSEDEEDVPPLSYDYYRNKLLADAMKKRNKQSTKKEENVLGDNIEEPEDNFELMKWLRVLQALTATNKFFKQIIEADTHELKQSLTKRLKSYMRLSDISKGNSNFLIKASAVQAFNPVIGKGINKTKANSATVGSFPQTFVDGFDEWLRYIGAQIVLNAFAIGDDIKLSTIIPNNYRLDELKVLGNTFLKRKYWESVKADVLVILNLVEFVVENSKQYHSQQSEKGRRRRGQSTPRDYISGLSTAHFKSLGTGKALINNSRLELPNWFPIESEDEIDLWGNLVEDHSLILRTLAEKKDEEYRILTLYREFLSSSNLTSFLNYMASYGILYMQRKDRKQYARQHSLEVFEGVCKRMSGTYSEIITNKGFREISKAMREATVSEQYRRTKGNQQFEIHYGLFQEIKRKAKFVDQFIAAVSTFINDYNVETSRKIEQKGDTYKGRQRISTEAMEEFISLLDQYPKQHETIGLLMVAVASCFDNSYKKEGDKE